MIIVAEPYAKFSATLGPSRLEPAARALLERVEPEVAAYYTQHLHGLPIRVFVRVERGSTRTWVSVGSVAAALVFYGDIRQSLDYLIRDAKAVAGIVSVHVTGAIGLPPQPPAVSQRRLGVPGKLHRLFKEVERGELSADEGTRRSVELLYEQAGPTVTEEVPGLTERLSTEFRDASRARSVPLRRKHTDEGRLLPLPTFTALPARRRTGVILSREASGDVSVSTY